MGEVTDDGGVATGGGKRRKGFGAEIAGIRHRT